MAPKANVHELRPGVTAEWVDPQEAQALSTDIQAQIAQLPVSIPDVATYRKVVESLPVLKRAEDKVVTFFKDIKARAHEAHKAITTKESEQLKPIQHARARLSQLKYAFEQEQDRIKRERERAEQEAEQHRREEEALAEAAALEAHSPELAEQVIQQAIAAPAPVVVLPSVTAAVEVQGVGKSKPRWVWRYVGAPDHETPWKKLSPEQRQRVMNLMPKNYMEPSESMITKVVSANEGNIKIPGVEIFDIGSTPVRG